MPGELIWKIGGEQGEGIDGAGEIFAKTLNRLGYYVFGYRHFMSLIKGGHTYYKIRVSDKPYRHPGDDLHLLSCFDQYSIEYNHKELIEGSCVCYDSSAFQATLPDGTSDGVELLPVPMTKLAEENGGKIMKNTVALGANAALIGLRPEHFQPQIEERFGGRKGAEVVAQNMKALQAGYDYALEKFGQKFTLSLRMPGATHFYMAGNEALGFGALAGGCRLVSFYPITPATEVSYWLFKTFPKVGGAMVQGEDEIAALNIAIGANYSGTRAMTATSGPGFSLMQEALGLAGMTETPVVVIDVQRAGPSTGLPTKTEQGDLNEALYGSHGEFPRIVLAPTTHEECFYYAAEAFNLADKYQCPVIIMSDLFLGTSARSIDVIDFDRLSWDRGQVLNEEDLKDKGRFGFSRYSDTPSGISPRTFPGTKNGRWIALSNEHDDFYEIEDPEKRVVGMNKRMRKLSDLDLSHMVHYDGPERPDILMVGWGSTSGMIEEAVEIMRMEGQSVAHMQVGGIWPFPEKAIRPAVAAARRVVVVENNFTGQFANLIKQQIGYHDKIYNVLKYDGDPFKVKYILDHTKGVLARGHVG